MRRARLAVRIFTCRWRRISGVLNVEVREAGLVLLAKFVSTTPRRKSRSSPFPFPLPSTRSYHWTVIFAFELQQPTQRTGFNLEFAMASPRGGGGGGGGSGDKATERDKEKKKKKKKKKET